MMEMKINKSLEDKVHLQIMYNYIAEINIGGSKLYFGKTKLHYTRLVYFLAIYVHAFLRKQKCIYNFC